MRRDNDIADANRTTPLSPEMLRRPKSQEGDGAIYRSSQNPSGHAVKEILNRLSFSMIQ